MEKLPQKLADQFDHLLHRDAIPVNVHSYYKKWLRFYWDFCHKYHHNPFYKDSLPFFLKKLQDKRQSTQQQKQAHHAITVFYQIKHSENNPLTNKDPLLNSSSLTGKQPVSQNKTVVSPPQMDMENQHVVKDQSEKSTTSTISSAIKKPSSLKENGHSWVFVFDKLQTEI